MIRKFCRVNKATSKANNLLSRQVRCREMGKAFTQNHPGVDRVHRLANQWPIKGSKDADVRRVF